MMLATGTTIAGYRIDGILGTGGMGVVYEATQLSLRRTVALKVLAPHLSADEAFAARFRREAMLQAALEHPSIVTVYEAGDSEDGLFLAMKLVRGTNLKQLILDGLPPRRALDLLEQIAAALDTAHDAGLIHRDVKPQNMLVDHEDRAFLADFGLTKGASERGITRTGQYMGSLDYVSPEQIKGGPLSARSDLYAFATVLYECLTGEVPFPRETEAALLYAHVTEPPPRVTELEPDLSPALDAIVARGLAKDPADRFPSATALVEAARAALDAGSAQAPAAAPSEPAAPSGGDPRVRFGETLVDPALVRTPPEIEAAPVRREVPPWLLRALAVAVPVLALIGFLLGRSGGEEREPSRNSASAGIVLLRHTDGWRRLEGREPIPGLSLADPITLEHDDGDQPATLRAGMATGAEGPLALPPAFLAQLEEVPTPETVRLGTVGAIRYRELMHRELDEGLTLYVVPTNRGAVTIACAARHAAPEQRAPSGAARCEDVAMTLTLLGAQPRELGPGAQYGAALDRAIARLVAERAPARIALADAETPAAQRVAARRLADVYRRARAGLRRIEPDLIEAPVHRALVSALDSAVGAYGALSRAARDGDPAAFERAKSNVRGAEDSVRRALGALGKLGYRIG